MCGTKAAPQEGAVEDIPYAALGACTENEAGAGCSLTESSRGICANTSSPAADPGTGHELTSEGSIPVLGSSEKFCGDQEISVRLGAQSSTSQMSAYVTKESMTPHCVATARRESVSGSAWVSDESGPGIVGVASAPCALATTTAMQLRLGAPPSGGVDLVGAPVLHGRSAPATFAPKPWFTRSLLKRRRAESLECEKNALLQEQDSCLQDESLTAWGVGSLKTRSLKRSVSDASSGKAGSPRRGWSGASGSSGHSKSVFYQRT